MAKAERTAKTERIAKAERYVFKIDNGVAIVSFPKDNILGLEFHSLQALGPSEAKGVPDPRTATEATEAAPDPRTATGSTMAAPGASVLTPALKAAWPDGALTVNVEESVVSFAAGPLRVVVWKYPFSIQVLTVDGRWVFRTDSLCIDESGQIRLDAERDRTDEVSVYEANPSLWMHHREQLVYGIQLDFPSPCKVDTESRMDVYTLRAKGTLRLLILFGPTSDDVVARL